MNTPVDIQVGELYLFPRESTERLWEYIGRKRKGRLVFVEKKTGTETRTLDVEEFIRFRAEAGKLVRVTRQTRTAEQAEALDGSLSQLQEVDPRLLLDENDPSLTGRQRQAIINLKKKYQRARTLRFYAMRHDEAPGTGLRDPPLSRLVADNANEAKLQGLEWRPSPGTLRRAINKCGVPGDRPLTAFLYREKGNGDYWHPKTLELKRELVAHYWSKEKPRKIDATVRFYTKFDKIKKKLDLVAKKPLARPDKETLRLWINAAECFETYRARNGLKAAQRRFRGQVRAITATRALQYVMFDETRGDAWEEVRDEDGNSLTEERPCLVLAVDVFSRMVLGAVLTFEPPSIFTVVECLKQVVRPKSFLPSDLKGYKGADDGWGKPFTIIVDNAWQYASPSFQIMCEAAGINVIWAPVRNPEYKCHVEHTIHIININFWHRLPSGVPHKPHVMSQLRLDPRSKADKTLSEDFDRLWRVICEICHVEPNDGIGMAPARAWRQSVLERGRPMIDDLSSLDRLLGTARDCLLTTSGVTVDGEDFHDPASTSALLNDMLRFARARDQRAAPLSTGTVRVLATLDAADCGYIDVWNAYRRRNVRLPNVKPHYAEGLPWKTARKARELAEQENLEFHSEEERCAVRDRLLRSFAPAIAELPFNKGRKLIRHHQRCNRLVPGETVVEILAEPSATGMEDFNVPSGLPAYERSDDRRPAKAPRRGGAKASRKAAARRRSLKNARAKDAPPQGGQSAPGVTQALTARAPESQNAGLEELNVADAEAVLARLKANFK